MKSTASPTVFRFLTSSSGIFTSNFSSALTTIVIMEIESMSRSSVNDLSSSTVSVAMPVSSLMSSARPASTSSVDNAIVLLLVGVSRLTERQSRWTGTGGSGQNHHLGAEHEAGAEADLEGEASRELRMLLEQPVRGEGDRGRRGVAGGLDVARDRDGFGQLQLLGELVDDAHVGLMGDERRQIGGGDARGIQCLLGDLRHVPDRPAEDRLALLTEGRPLGLAVAVLGERAVHADRAGLRAVGSPDGAGDAREVARADHDGARAVAQEERDAAVGWVDDVRELLGADDERVVGAAGANQ